MLTSIRTRADDVRALAGAIVLGSSAGLVIGGAYLAGNVGKPALQPVPAGSAPLQATAVQPSRPAGAVRVAAASSIVLGASAPISKPQSPLRDRFRMASAAFQAAAQPFRFQQVANAPSDLHCLTEAVYFEARGEARAGQQAVAQVVLNRVRHPAFPKTICAVVHQHTGAGCQFSFACSSRQSPIEGVAWRRAEAIAAGEMHGAVMTAVGDATHFQAVRASPFAGLLKVAQIGAHIFYRFGGHAGAPTMFSQTPVTSTAPAKMVVARLDSGPASKADQAVPDGGRVKVTLYPAPAAAPAAAVKAEVTAVKLVAQAPADTKPAPAPPAHAAAGPAPALLPPAKAGAAPEVKPDVISVALAQS